jgi:hypothetical protein
VIIKRLIVTAIAMAFIAAFTFLVAKKHCATYVFAVAVLGKVTTIRWSIEFVVFLKDAVFLDFFGNSSGIFANLPCNGTQGGS